MRCSPIKGGSRENLGLEAAVTLSARPTKKKKSEVNLLALRKTGAFLQGAQGGLKILLAGSENDQEWCKWGVVETPTTRNLTPTAASLAITAGRASSEAAVPRDRRLSAEMGKAVAQ